MAFDVLLDHAAAEAVNPGAERRLWKRLKINWSLLVYRASDDRPVASRTENISSGGLYFFSALPFQIGERLHCIVVIPPQSSRADRNQFLACDVRVVRIDAAPFDGFGIGCLIEDHWLQSTAQRCRRAAGA